MSAKVQVNFKVRFVPFLQKRPLECACKSELRGGVELALFFFHMPLRYLLHKFLRIDTRYGVTLPISNLTFSIHQKKGVEHKRSLYTRQ